MNSTADAYYRTLLDAIPHMILVVDGDVRVRDLNQAALAVLGPDQDATLARRGGEILHCIHATDSPEGCGRGLFCKDCIIRNSVTECLRGRAVTRRRTKAELIQGGKQRELELLITASPLPGGDDPLVLLIIEDISEISTLRDILPICVRCKNIREDEKFWRTVEDYFKSQIGVDFSHGICPTCMKELYPEYADKIHAENETDGV